MKVRLEAINVLAELERMGIPFDPAGENEVRVTCPVHGDENPSVGMNTAKALWKCHACSARGDFITFIAHHTGAQRETIVRELQDRYDLIDVVTINPELVEKYHNQVWDSGPLLKELRKRGLTDAMIRQGRLGFLNGRITIPVYDDQGRVVNLRRYLPGGSGADKMRNARGHGDARIYLPEQIRKYDELWFCGGELKALVVAGLLNDHDQGAFSVSAGEGMWDPKWSERLRDKRVHVCMDIDPAGRRAAEKVAVMIASFVESVDVIELPLDPERYPKGDVNDYVGGERATAENLLELAASAPPFVPTALSQPEQVGEAINLPLSQVTRPRHVGRAVAFEGVVVALHDTPYVVPKTVRVSCDRDQQNCTRCPIYVTKPEEGGYVEADVPASSKYLLEMISSPSRALRDACRKALRIPPCKPVKFLTRTYQNVYDTRVSPQLSVGSSEESNLVLPAMTVTDHVELNVPYALQGVVHPHPKTQEATVVVSGMDEVEDSLATFAPSTEELADLTQFQPRNWSLQSLREKLDLIYSELEGRVTRIYQRRDLHLALDLAFHSPLLFDFDGRMVNGWTQVLVVGDSSQGKSEASQRLAEYYGLGERVDCKNATVAGILGGLQQMGTRWFVSWGVIPTHDRRLVILDELKGADPEVFQKLTDMRSSGIAEVPKIERRRAQARTRLIVISNPRSNRPMSSHSFGVEAVRELIGSLEDVRRFDLAVVVSKAQVDPSVVNRLSSRPTSPQVTFSAENCRRLVLWAWTRRRDQVRFESDAVTLCLEGAVELCGTYTEDLPLVDRGTMRLKLARLAAALAARTFSSGDGGETLVVRRCHVEFVMDMIRRLYDDPHCGYRDFSKAKSAQTEMIEPELVEKAVLGTHYPADFVRQMLNRDDITWTDIGDWCEMEREAATRLISLLVRKHALFRDKGVYRKTGEFIALLRRMDADGLTNKQDVREMM